MTDILEIFQNLAGSSSTSTPISARNNEERRALQQRQERVRSRRRRLRRFRTVVEEQQRSQSDMILNIAIVITGFCTAMYSPVSTWVINRSMQWWEVDAMRQFTDRQWSENFRMTRPAFQLLCNQLQPHIVRKATKMRRPVCVAKLVGLTLYRLATGEAFRTIGNLFGVGRTTAFDGFWAVCQAILKFLKPVYIKRPKGAEVHRMLQIFEMKFGFPMCGGAIDGTHIPIIAPDFYRTDYYNRKGWYSIILQGLVNHEYKFIDFDVGHPGKCHDSYVFESSKLYKKLENGTFYPNMTRMIEGQEIPIVILGDSAYSLSKYLMKPHPEGLADGQQKRFNERLSRARIIVEHSFGRLKGRWRCIMKRNDSHACKIHIVVTACIVLHNFCETWKGAYDDHNNVDDEQEQPDINQVEDDGDGELIRNALTKYFANHQSY